MSNTFKPTAPEATASRWSLNSDTFHRVFVGEHGIRSGWSVLLFAAIFFILQAAVTAALGRFISLDSMGPIPLSLGVLQ